jgi:hypothetical protein
MMSREEKMDKKLRVKENNCVSNCPVCKIRLLADINNASSHLEFNRRISSEIVYTWSKGPVNCLLGHMEKCLDTFLDKKRKRSIFTIGFSFDPEEE